MPLVRLNKRAVLAVTGDDRVAFLQGLVSNDVVAIVPGNAVHTALLTPQGRYLYDFFVVPDGDRFLIDIEQGILSDFVRFIERHVLRSRVFFTILDSWRIYVSWPDKTVVRTEEVICVPDPRTENLGYRLLTPVVVAGASDHEELYHRHRIALGVPDGSQDLVRERSLLLENGFDILRGVSWTKGCYIGQEVTARMYYRGLVRRHLTPVEVEGPLPDPGMSVMSNGKRVGEVRSGVPGLALALIDREALYESVLISGDARLLPRLPPWLVNLPVVVAKRV